jgi:hypothetical protein
VAVNPNDTDGAVAEIDRCVSWGAIGLKLAAARRWCEVTATDYDTMLAEGRKLTRDLGGSAGTSEIAEAIASRV